MKKSTENPPQSPQPKKRVLAGSVKVMPTTFTNEIKSDPIQQRVIPKSSTAAAVPKPIQSAAASGPKTTTAISKSIQQADVIKQSTNNPTPVVIRPQTNTFQTQATNNPVCTVVQHSQQQSEPTANTPSTSILVDNYMDRVEANNYAVYSPNLSDESGSSSGVISETSDTDSVVEVIPTSDMNIKETVSDNQVSDSQQGSSKGAGHSAITPTNAQTVFPSVELKISSNAVSHTHSSSTTGKRSTCKTFAPLETTEKLEQVYKSFQKIQDTIQKDISNGSATDLQQLLDQKFQIFVEGW